MSLKRNLRKLRSKFLIVVSRTKPQRAFVWVAAIPPLLGVVAFWAGAQYHTSIERVSHTKDVLAEVDGLQLTLSNAENEQRGYLLTGDEWYFHTFETESEQIGVQVNRLRRLTLDNPAQQKNISRLESALEKRMARMTRVFVLRRESGLPREAAISGITEGTNLMKAIRDICRQMETEENRLMARRVQDQRAIEAEVTALFSAGILGCAILLYWAYRLIHRYESQRDLAEAALRELNMDLEARVHLRTQELEEANERLTRSNADLTRFAYVASHDLQEPLRTVGSYAGLLARRYQNDLDPQAHKYIRFVVDGAKRMQTLVQDLLAYSRVGTQSLRFENADANEVVRRAMENLRTAIQESSANILVEPLPKIYADGTKLLQVFQNLVGNAIKFRQGGLPPRIEISARRENGDWVFSVRDNGIGFEQQYAEKIFVIFQRLHGIGTFAGTGIGLAISKRIVEEHGGRIWAESAPNQGATFLFTLPAKPQAAIAKANGAGASAAYIMRTVDEPQTEHSADRR